jgi:CRP-like cAMP-binding protein
VFFQNRLLRLIGPEAVARLGETPLVPLPMRYRLDEPGNERFVYFFEEGVASIIADVDAKLAVELGIIGREGMVGLGVVYEDATNPYQTIIQVEGNAVRVEADRLRSVMRSDHAVFTILIRFARAFSIQVANTALANGRFKLDERLARWLLMVGDRAGTTFPITHDFISVMLGVRRSGVTTAIQLLESQGLIRANRGSITLLNRKGLIKAANGAYGFAEAHYERLLADAAR